MSSGLAGAPDVQFTDAVQPSGWASGTPAQSSGYAAYSGLAQGPQSKRQLKAAEYRAARNRNLYGYLGCVLGLVAFLFNFFGVPSILAIVFGSIGIATSRRLGGGKGTGAGWSVSGLILGLVGLAGIAWNFYRLHATGVL